MVFTGDVFVPGLSSFPVGLTKTPYASAAHAAAEGSFGSAFGSQPAGASTGASVAGPSPPSGPASGLGSTVTASKWLQASARMGASATSA